MGRDGPNLRLWIRRAHLYAGLALLPWVLLYAVSGLLFNHPAWGAPSDGVRRFALSELSAADDPRAVLDAETAAHAVAAALGDDVLVEPSPPPQLTRRLRATRAAGSEGDADDALHVRFPARKGSWGSHPEVTPRVPEGFEQLGPLDVPDHDASAWQRLADELASELDGADTHLEVSRTPTVRFHALIEGESWAVDYNAHSGTVEFEPVADRDIRVPRLLARLHMTHVYPNRFGVDWLHTLLVDLSALCLVLWALTGVFMWWQMRRVRTVGWIVTASGLVLATAVLADVIPRLLA